MTEILIVLIIGIIILYRILKTKKQRNEFEKIKKYGDQINISTRKNKKL